MNMFYHKTKDNVLRFGDVLKGFILVAPNIKVPNSNKDYTIDINLPVYSVVLTPCCSIGESVISLTPLIPVLSDFLTNPYFKEDLTRINRKMQPEQSLSPEKWKKLSLQEQQSRQLQGEEYALLQYFIYKDNEIFPQYELKSSQLRYYMINFKNTHKIKCGMIKEAKLDTSLLELKCLQLSIQARTELRYKIANYYSRTPEEDMILGD